MTNDQTSQKPDVTYPDGETATWVPGLGPVVD
jgi:hypothetical protein